MMGDKTKYRSIGIPEIIIPRIGICFSIRSFCLTIGTTQWLWRRRAGWVKCKTWEVVA